MHEQAPPSPHLSAIDVVRFCCAGLVVAYHYAAALPIQPPAFVAAAVARDGLARGGAAWTRSGWIGVEIFFVVSGYVIATTAMRGDGWDFARRRALRLLPAAWICATITVVTLLLADAIGGRDAALRWIGSLILVPGLPKIDSTYWTLDVEITFYALVAPLLRRTAANAVAIERIGLVLACVSLAYWPDHGGAMWNSAAAAFGLLIVPNGCFFAVGIALWSLHYRGPSAVALATLVAGVTASVVAIVGHAASIDQPGLAAGPAVPLLLFAAAVATIANASRLQSALGRWPGANRLASLGLMTYPLYLVHQFAGDLLIMALRARGLSSAGAIATAMAIAVAAAWLIAHHVEPPLRSWLASQLKSRRARRPDSLPTASLRAG